MKVEALKPAPTERQVFSLAAVRHVPVKPGCYVLGTYDGIILYIGLAKQLRKRVMQHLKTPEKTEAGAQGRAHWVWYAGCAGEHEINRLERGWLNQHELAEGMLPALNSIRSPVT